jgi:hypothetical protein
MLEHNYSCWTADVTDLSYSLSLVVAITSPLNRIVLLLKFIEVHIMQFAAFFEDDIPFFSMISYNSLEQTLEAYE